MYPVLTVYLNAYMWEHWVVYFLGMTNMFLFSVCYYMSAKPLCYIFEWMALFSYTISLILFIHHAMLVMVQSG